MKSIKPIKAPESLKSALNRDVNKRAFEIRSKMKTKPGKQPSPRAISKANKFVDHIAKISKKK